MSYLDHLVWYYEITKNKVKENEEEAKETGACLREEPKLKRRKMSAKRDFPPGCGPSGTNDVTQEPDGESMASDTEEEPEESMMKGEVYGDNEDFVLTKVIKKAFEGWRLKS
ncbi:hypothetical protein L1987_06018 [Smallanthus sonchifolius]|uniref:Uncharacterized protein n=1 Tax=Smallanthus sonchifolius TaxID=185202 RepID=A0ACB9JX53_9ASTR|nr:hypothetical protein L1987_06018 [Smallanthus sonchifolius]